MLVSRRFTLAMQLPNHLHDLLQARLSSTSTSSKQPYPYPNHPRPTPHQIFHLPKHASQAEIKARYFDLVRAHHPDSHHCRTLSPTERRARFQSIGTAYEILRAGNVVNYTGGASNFDPYMHELARRRRHYYAYQDQKKRNERMNDEYNRTGHEGGWHEKVILAFGILALIGGLYPGLFLFPSYAEKTHRSAVRNLSEARSDAVKVGNERRAEMRKRVQAHQVQREGVASEGTSSRVDGR